MRFSFLLLNLPFFIAAPLFAFADEEILNLARRGLLDSAKILTLQNYKKEPDNSFYTFMLGKLSHSGEESLKYFDKTVRLSPGDQELEEALYQTAQYYHAKGLYPQAITYYRKASTQFPNGDWKAPSLYWMGHACLNYSQVAPPYSDTAKVYFGELLKAVREDHYYYPMGLEGLARWGLETKNYPFSKKHAIRGLEKSFPDQKPLLLYYLIRVAKDTRDSLSEVKFTRLLEKEFSESMEYRNIKPHHHLSASKSVKSKEDVPYFLQMGAFSSRANAENLVQKLKKKKIDAEISEKSNKGKVLFTVRTPIFKSESEAQRYGEEKLKTLGIAYYLLQKN